MHQHAERPGTGGGRCLAGERLSQRCPFDTRVHRDQRSQATYGSHLPPEAIPPSRSRRTWFGPCTSADSIRSTRRTGPASSQRTKVGGRFTGPRTGWTSVHTGSRPCEPRSHRLSLHPFPWLARIRRHLRSRSFGSTTFQRSASLRGSKPSPVFGAGSGLDRLTPIFSLASVGRSKRSNGPGCWFGTSLSVGPRRFCLPCAAWDLGNTKDACRRRQRENNNS